MNAAEASTTTLAGEVVTVHLHGDADLAVVDALLATFARARSVDGVRRIVVDLSDVGFMDSSGLGALVAGFRFAHQDGIAFDVADPTEPVRSLLAMTGVASLFTGSDDDRADWV